MKFMSIKAIMQQLLAYMEKYPESLERMYILNVAWSLKTMISGFLKGFVDPVTAAKFQFYGGKSWYILALWPLPW